MTSLLPPVRFLSTVDEGLLQQSPISIEGDAAWHHEIAGQHHHPNKDDSNSGVNGLRDILPLRHDYLRSLIFAQRWAGKGHWGGSSGHRRLTVSERDLGIEIPQTTAAPRLLSRRGPRHSRSQSEPFFGTPRMAAVMEEKEEGLENVVPSSPPDLSYSKSSQSSSSSVDGDGDDDNVSTDKLSQFDDVSVDGRDSVEDSNLRPQLLAEISNLIRETDKAYASHHYNVYHFLLTLSDATDGEGLEHGQSSDNGVGEKAFSDQKHQLVDSDLLSHEFTHSWNGKYRRPFNLYQTDFSKPQVGELLWVYEGMTQYMGNVLAARDGMWSPENYREMLALTAANLDNKPGRLWRSTDDTAIAASVLRSNSPAWSNWRLR